VGPTLAGLIGVFFGTILGAAASLVGALVNQRGQRERDRDTYRRALQDAKFERLRIGYAKICQAMLAMRQVASELEFSEGDPSLEARNERLKILDENMAGVNATRAELLIETDAGAVMTAADEAAQAFRTFWRGLTRHDATAEEILGARDRLHSSLERLRDVAKKQLDELQRPI
jgi:hypothetical protein